jgi:error-prone DNA polymerase
MKDRTIIEWDKDDIDAIGLMKVDVLALGMLTALKRSFDMLPPLPDGRRITDISHIPQEDPLVYDMLCEADSVGVFQVESRAQMSMLPRLKPRKFYDLVIEVAIVRPGPIQGDMVHPYLRRRDGLEKAEYPSPSPEHGPADELKHVLYKTYGVPLFQEQAMRLAIEAAKFTDDEADGLRRSMATFRADGKLWTYRDKFIEGMVRRGYRRDFAERCFKQIEGFGSYGFPESHAISFAILVYVSAWVKRHHPEVFCAALLNSQPMGFYQPAQLVRDAREHGVEVRPPDIVASDWDCTLEPPDDPRSGGRRALRLGLRQVRGLKQKEAEDFMAVRAEGGLTTIEDYVLRSGLSRRGLELLAEADAFRSLGLSRRDALWTVKGMADEVGAERTAPLVARQSVREAQVLLPFMSQPKEVAEDYRTTSLSLKAHPVSFYREDLARMRAVPCAALKAMGDRRRVSVGGLVLVRQRPGTAKGVVFLTLEDETGIANIVCWKDAFDANRRLVMSSSFLVVHGQLQVAGNVIHLVAERFTDLSHKLGEMRDDEGPPPQAKSRVTGRLIRSRDFH